MRPAVLLYAGAVPGRPGPPRPDGLFSHILTASELGLEKRDPVLYRRAAEQCGVPNGDCVLFDDSPLACAAARKAGWQVYGVADPIFAHQGAEMGKVCHVYPFKFEGEL